MAFEPNGLMVASCRHCLRPITLTAEIDALEHASLLTHLRNCAAREPEEERPDGDELVRHFRMVSNF
jgi:hypothetical protein